MSTRKLHLAQFNIADARFETDQPEMHGFTSRIEAINTLAERSTGFVWRLVDDGPDDGALNVRMEGLGETTLINMSVWDTLELLYSFVYQTAHAKVMRGKNNWFNPMIRPHMVLWWIEAGHRPDLDEAYKKLMLIRDTGPTPQAFSFDVPFGQDGRPITPPTQRKACA